MWTLQIAPLAQMLGTGAVCSASHKGRCDPTSRPCLLVLGGVDRCLSSVLPGMLKLLCVLLEALCPPSALLYAVRVETSSFLYSPNIF